MEVSSCFHSRHPQPLVNKTAGTLREFPACRPAAVDTQAEIITDQFGIPLQTARAILRWHLTAVDGTLRPQECVTSDATKASRPPCALPSSAAEKALKSAGLNVSLIEAIRAYIDARVILDPLNVSILEVAGM